MSTITINIYLENRYRDLVDSILSDAFRISPYVDHFTPAWKDSNSIMGHYMFEASAEQVTNLLSDIYIFGKSTIYEKSLMYEISKQCIACLELFAR